MANATFPGSLQQLWNRDGFQISRLDNREMTPFEVGPTKSRVLTTRSRFTIIANIWVTSAEYTVLDLFYYSTLNQGTQKFDHPHPIDGQNYAWLFGPGGIIYRPLSGDLFSASFNLISD